MKGEPNQHSWDTKRVKKKTCKKGACMISLTIKGKGKGKEEYGLVDLLWLHLHEKGLFLMG